MVVVSCFRKSEDEFDRCNRTGKMQDAKDVISCWESDFIIEETQRERERERKRERATDRKNQKARVREGERRESEIQRGKR